MKILSWNVNGIRAVYKKGFLNWLNSENQDILCIQETKSDIEKIPSEIKNLNNYYKFYSSSKEKKGYSGVMLLSKEKPVKVKYGINIEKFDKEGRIIISEYKKFILFNVYFPNGKASKERLKYKMDFYYAFLNYVKKEKRKGHKIIICGDVNTAHKEIDLARPKENEKVSGFLPEERAWIDKLLESGFIDTFRVFNKEGGNYTWWDLKSHARERNVGWRIDYFFISENLKKNLESAFILKDVYGSDHCPIGIELKI